MKNYAISGTVTTVVNITVIAENEKEAIRALIGQIRMISGTKEQDYEKLIAEENNTTGD